MLNIYQKEKKGKPIGPRPEEVKQKISKSKTGKTTSLLNRPQSPEHVKKRVAGCCKPIQNVATGQIFASITEASNYYHKDRVTIRKQIKQNIFEYITMSN